MIRTLIATALLVASMSLASVSTRAAESVAGVPVNDTAPAIVVTPELVEAHHALALAKLRMQQYRFVELPRQRRQLDNQVKRAEAETGVLRRRLKDYRPFLQVGRYSPVRTAAESHQLALLAAGQRLEQLKDERIALMRYTRQTYQLYQLDILAAATRASALSQSVTRPSNNDDGARGTAR